MKRAQLAAGLAHLISLDGNNIRHYRQDSKKAKKKETI